MSSVCTLYKFNISSSQHLVNPVIPFYTSGLFFFKKLRVKHKVPLTAVLELLIRTGIKADDAVVENS